MKISKTMYNMELRVYYYPLRIFANIISKKWGIKLINKFMKMNKGKNIKELHCEELYIPSKNNGPDIRLRIFKPTNNIKKLNAMLYIHAGGYMLDIPEGSLDIIKNFIEKRNCVIVAPDYRKSLKNPYPDGFNDCYDTLLWMKENAKSLNINSQKFIIAGHSAGGGLTAAITLKARDTNDINIAFQMPIYPMIDCKQNTNSAKEMKSVPVWNSKTNKVAWDLYLRNIKDNIPYYASPSLNNYYKNLPPTITFVSNLEPFKDETINYIKALEDENISVKFKLFNGAFHGFDKLAKTTDIGKQAYNFQYDSFAEYFDKYTN